MKSLKIALALCLSLTSLNISLAAIPKPGTSCPKMGLTLISNGIKYTCIKSGKILIWNKGQKIPVVNPTISISPSNQSTSPTPLPTSSNSPTPTTMQSPSAIPTVSPTPTPNPLPLIELNSFQDLEKNFQEIAFFAWKKSKEKIDAEKSVAMNVEILLGPNAKLNYLTPEIPISLVNRLYAGAKLPTKVVHLVFAFEDRDWAMAKMDVITPNSSSSWVKDVACPTKSTCFGGGSFFNFSTRTSLIVLANGIDPNNINNSISGTVEAHEYAHVIEQTSSNTPRPAVNLLMHPWPPNWYWEGLAQFSQNAAVYSDSFDQYLKHREYDAGQLFSDKTWNASNIEAYFQRNLTQEWSEKYPRWRQYDLGSMLVEILVALRGPDIAMKMFNESINGGGFDAAFQRLYGSSFESVLPLISRTIALELGH